MTASQFVGVDVAKKTLDVHILEGSRRFSLPYDSKGLKQLAQKLPDPQLTLVVVEATGGYHKRLVAELLDAGFAVAVVNPKRVRDYAKAHGFLAKTDKLDARVIALFAEHFRPLCEQKCSAQRAELEELVVRRRQLLALRTSENNRRETITAPSVRKSIQIIIDQLNKEIDRVEKAILELLESDDDWKRKKEIIESVPGLGPASSAALVAELPELGEVNRQQAAALVGVAPYADDSGQHKGQRHIRGGRAPLRCTLYMAALTARRCNPVIQAFADRLEKAGKPFKLILTACMRKLVVILNSLIQNNTPWQSRIPAENA